MTVSRGRRLIALIIAALLTVAGTGYGAASTASAAAARVTLNLADVLPDSDPGTLALDNFAKLVGADTGGAVQITVYPHAQLANEKTIVTALRSGTVDMGLAAVSFWTSLIPGIDALGWPYVVTTWQQASAIATSEAVNAYYRSVYSKEGVVLVAALPYTWKELASTKEVTSPGDLRGMKVRTAGGTGTAFLPLFGAVAPVLSNSELYQALLTHTVQAANLSTSQTISLKVYEVAKYFTMYNLYMIWLPVFINQGAWEKLTKAEQGAMLGAGLAMIRQHIAGAAKTQAEQRQLLLSNGVHITTIDDFTPWKQVVAPGIKQKQAASEVARRLLDLGAKAAGGR